MVVFAMDVRDVAITVAVVFTAIFIIVTILKYTSNKMKIEDGIYIKMIYILVGIIAIAIIWCFVIKKYKVVQQQQQTKSNNNNMSSPLIPLSTLSQVQQKVTLEYVNEMEK
uniref:Uncharacterized protein LOC114326506 n=1 Tax=Diabrotica virgifera virgifera TaxID=50390 RepID=A0A6P7FAW6_DIAVI